MNKIAVVGMSGIFPGALNIEAFKQNIIEKRESIIEVPQDRWIIKADDVISKEYEPDRACSKRAGLVTGFKFDPDGYLIEAAILEKLDPLQQMVLHSGKDALAQCFVSQEIRKRAGVILAAIALPTEKSSELAWQIKNSSGCYINSIDATAASMVSTPAALLARAMGLMGGSFTLDAACASSLYAIKIACEELILGRADMMVAGGVSRPDSLYTQIGFTQLKALSPSGRCSPFDKSADGLVVGEGTGVVVLKRLKDAIECKDHIWGVISGAGWSNDIEGNLVAPASEGQIRAMRAAYKSANLSPSDVQYVECHGSATPVGDNIELNSLKTLWQEASKSNYGCAIGSVKSMVGHLLTAAGAAGFIKTLLAINEKFLPPSLNFYEPAPDSPLLTTGFYVQTETEDWKTNPKTPRRAGISAFGFGGINAHIIVEEFKEENSYSQVPIDFMVPNPVAIVGMEVITPVAQNLEEFKNTIFHPEDTSQNCIKNSIDALWLKSLEIKPGEFHIPPNQIKDLLPQHLIMLKAAMGAIKDANISSRPNNRADKENSIRTDFGAAIGIEFDYGATDFHLRWRRAKASKTEDSEFREPQNRGENRESNGDTYPPLTAERTLGALGGIVASRVAREFKIGGPCFTISAQAGSGIKALEIAIKSLQMGETKTFLCGSVDMAGDVRQNTINRALRNFAPSYDESAPFDETSKGLFPSEGAAAIVLKTLKQAQIDGDRIYAVIKGVGSGSGGRLSCEPYFTNDNSQNIYKQSLVNALNSAKTKMSDIGLYLGHGSGDLTQDTLELNAINNFSALTREPSEKFEPFSSAISSTSATVGDTHAVSGLLSIVHSALAIYHKIIPPLPKFKSPSINLTSDRLYFAKFPTFWIKGDLQDRRRAVVAAITSDGCCSHVVVEESISPSSDHLDHFGVVNLDHKIYKNRENLFDIDFKEFSGIEQIGKIGKIAFLYPGSGNHFLGMGRKLGVMFSDILDDMDKKGGSLNRRFLPALYYPKRISYRHGWQDDAQSRINSHSHNMIFGQVSFGFLMTRVAEKFGLKADACIGHSLGETAGLFALKVWNDPEDMLRRMEASDLFTKKLGGDFLAAKKVWGLKQNEKPQWRVAAVNRDRDFVKSFIESNKYDKLYLLIVNRDDECVVGGSLEQVEDFIRKSGCGAMYLDGVVTVHCPILQECWQEYLDLHKFECNPPHNIDFYSCFLSKKYIPETMATAESILNQALYGFDYTKLINNAWSDGVRVFIEMGPGSSCTRAVTKILQDKEHFAISLSASSKDEDEEIALKRALSELAKIGRSVSEVRIKAEKEQILIVEKNMNCEEIRDITADAHIKFLELSQKNMAALEHQFSCLTQIASTIVNGDQNINPSLTFTSVSSKRAAADKTAPPTPPLFDRDMCMEFAVGLASNVLGHAFKEIDNYPVRVRLPDEPLMLVDRIVDIQGEMLSLKSGKITTQHDVKAGAWYLDGGKAPVSISIEAGQADLFLCSWLGIDHVVKGSRRYRLLDAKVTFHRTLPEAGETIEYQIEIDRFLKQGEIYLFFFHYQGFIVSKDGTDELLISMRDGCAGFFTIDEVKNSGGIILKKEDKEPAFGNINQFIAPVKIYKESYTDAQVEQLRHGHLEACFGNQFAGVLLGKNLRLPSGKMHLIDRVLELNPTGGRFGIGFIAAEADIYPDDWFLTCHFVDDMVMPGTLMYECCAHALRVFTQRVGWITQKDEPFYDVIPSLESDLKCRGPVTTATKKARYEIEVKEIGYNSNKEPYIIADAHMFSDDHRIVLYKNMGMRIVGLSKDEIELFWSER
ncbi:MAG: hypothetical protein HQK74_05030 [Desulfamplus sp.]|nr:hypothetical protein [Desulfamplus sp.]